MTFFREQILEVKSFPLRSIKKFYMKATSGLFKINFYLSIHIPTMLSIFPSFINQTFYTLYLGDTIYSVEGEWEYFFAPFRKGVKSFKKGLRMKFGYLEGQFIDFMEDSGG